MSEGRLVATLTRMLSLGPDWRMGEVADDPARKEVRVRVERRPGLALTCPECGRTCRRYDTRERVWRHLDIWDHKTLLVCGVPRVECPEHGVTTLRVPWAVGRARYTAEFEAEVIERLQDASILAVSRQMRISWNAVSGIMGRAVKRGLARREREPVRRLSVDETSFRRGHRYVTVVSDPDTKRVLHVAEGRGRDALESFYRTMGKEWLAGVESVSMDMWRPYVAATREWVEGAERKIAFDRFHVASHLGDAVDKVRRVEHRQRREEGDPVLTGTKHQWLKGRGKMTHAEKLAFAELRKRVAWTAEAWAVKEAATKLWDYRSRTWAERAWLHWLEWADGTGLRPVRRAAQMVRSHLWGVLNAVVLRATNGPAEGINSRIRRVKIKSQGFRNQDRFVAAILFHLGGLDLLPRPGQG